MVDEKLRVLISSEKIQARIRELGEQISQDYPSGNLHMICILKGACFFLAALARAMKTPARIEFIGISSYGKGKTSSGEVRLTKDLDATQLRSGRLTFRNSTDSVSFHLTVYLNSNLSGSENLAWHQ